MASGRPAGNQRWLVPTVLLLVVLPIGIAVSSAVSSRGDGGDKRPELRRTGSKVIDSPAGKALAFADAEPVTYEVTYRIELYGPTSVKESTERLTVRRPFDSRIITTIAGKEVGHRVSRLGTLVLNTGTGPRGLVSPPSPASGDLRLVHALPEGVAAGYVDVRERRRIAGAVCQVYRLGSTVGAGELVPVGAKPNESAEICVDEHGLLLEEVWQKNGRPLQRRVATKRVLDPPLTDADFEVANETPLTIDEGNGFLRSVDPASAFDGTVYRIPQAPAGFTYVGRIVVQPPKLSPFRSPLDDGPQNEQVSLVDTWERGPDLLVFSQTIAAAITAIPNDARTAKPLDLGPFGKAATVLDLRSSEVRIELPEDRFIRIAGSLPVADLVEVAKSLRAEVGTGLVFTED